MNTETLISKVFMKPEIWDKELKEHSNRVIVDACWREMSKEMGVPEAALRKKWKYLRDQFSVEFGKINLPHLRDPGNTPYHPKWPHYKSLLFLKDVVKPRTSPSVLKKQCSFNEPNDDDDNEDSIIHETGVGQDYSDNDLENEQQGNEQLKHFQSSGEGYNVKDSRGKKRRCICNTKCNESIFDIEKKKHKCSQDVVHYPPENDDLLFFRSLLPHVSKIPSHLKMRFRNRIHEVVEEFAYSSYPSTFQLPSTNYISHNTSSVCSSVQAASPLADTTL